MKKIDLSSYLHGGVLTLSFFHFMNHLYSLSLPPLFPLLKKHFEVGNTEVGLITAVISFMMVILQLPLGIYSDRFGRRKLLSLGLLFMMTATLLISFGNTFWVILGFVGLLGIGLSTYHPVGTSAIADLATEENTGKLMSMQAVGGSLGVGLAPLILGGLASFLGWRLPLRFLALAGLPLLVILFFTLDETKTEGQRGKLVLPSLTLTVVLALFYFLRGFVFKSITTFLPTYFVEIKGLSLVEGGLNTSIFLLTGVFVQPIGGILADRWNRVFIIIASSLGSAVVLFALVSLPITKGVVYLLLILLGGFLYLTVPSVLSFVKQISPSEGYGMSFGFIFSSTALAGAIAPILVGYLGDKFSLSLAFKILPLLLVLAGLSIFLIRKHVQRPG